MSNQKQLKSLKAFNITGLIHTIISVAVFVLSVLNYVYQTNYYYRTIEILSSVTLLNSLIWLICGFILIKNAKHLNNKESIKKTRLMLLICLLFVLSPDIVMVVLFYIPSLSGNKLINLIGFISPVLVFLGWFLGKKLGKRI